MLLPSLFVQSKKYLSYHTSPMNNESLLFRETSSRTLVCTLPPHHRRRRRHVNVRQQLRKRQRKQLRHHDRKVYQVFARRQHHDVHILDQQGIDTIKLVLLRLIKICLCLSFSQRNDKYSTKIDYINGWCAWDSNLGLQYVRRRYGGPVFAEQ